MKSSWRLFLSQTIGAFHSTGAICPSSTFLARSMTRPLDQRDGRGPVRVLEVGPGTGAFSRSLAHRLKPGDQLDLVELNPVFAEWMRRWVGGLRPSGPEVQVYEEDILRFEPEAAYDLVISGLPLNNFSPAFVEQVFRKLVRLGRPGATISFFQYLGLRRMKGVFLRRAKRDRLRQVGQVIEGWIARHGVGMERVWLNVPPAGVYYLRKPLEPDPEQASSGLLV